jgi:hypothetical protein
MAGGWYNGPSNALRCKSIRLEEGRRDMHWETKSSR